ncbi:MULTISPECIES: hypothetical protein [Vibrio]|uniref:hypothetical protein n=1 Tax=Vibrio TaxID=662 RepID=UPI0004A23E7A|nr:MULTISPECIES: hypothetical protein [Vibrio]EGQ7665364.1 hypothetical protein [Vibrio parahaemolyticus]EGQ8945848.1 hypothetical protein [Vibrio parahaemolyticus]EGR0036446.1 hypothetical protein [Vibrio parahaemolyticus]EGR0204745.1 hypothetical protein [Vibrio parahaemolyticus]EGR2293540.1 hypothetical protein [Vibrio parahaemolyticus]
MESSDVIALSAAIIAFVTAIVSIWQGALNRKYYRLSTKPHLIIDQTRNEEVPTEFTLKNNGLGPAIIISFDVFVDDVLIETDECPVVKALSVIGATRINLRIHTPSVGEAIAVSSEIIILGIVDGPYSESTLQALKQLDCSVKFKIVYESMYGEKFTYIGNC